MDDNLFILKNARLIDPGKREAAPCDILIRRHPGEDSEIVEIARRIPVNDRESGRISSANLHSKYVAHSFIDLRCNFTPRRTHRGDDIVTGTLAAVSGGFGAVLLSPEEGDVTPSAIMQKAAEEKKWASCRVMNCAPLTLPDRATLCSYAALADAGATAFCDCGGYLASDVMRGAMRECAKADLLVIAGTQDSAFDGGCVNEGRVANLLGVRGKPAIAEELAVARNIMLAEETGCRLHIPIVSTSGTVRLVREAKRRGVRVTCGTAVQYFSLCEDDILFFGANAKVNPPLRRVDDRDAVIAGIADRTIDCISSDHTPVAAAEKALPLGEAPFGAVGLETAFCAAVTYLLIPGKIDLFRLTELFTSGPAAVIRTDCSLEAGHRADFVTIDTDAETVFSENMMKGASYNTPFGSMPLRGSVDGKYIMR